MTQPSQMTTSLKSSTSQTKEKQLKKLKDLARKHPVRIAAWVSSTVVLIVTLVSPDVDPNAAVMFVLSTLGLGEYAQRVENKKTKEASIEE